MKVPLEPIPTEQIILVEQDQPRASVVLHKHKHEDARVQRDEVKPSQLDKAYPWLLGASTCLSALLCWMYVTKPVITQASEPGSEQVVRTDVAADHVATNTPAVTQPGRAPAAVSAGDLIPSDSSLPGGKPDAAEPVVKANHPTSPQAIAPGKLVAGHGGQAGSEIGLGMESTNLKVQHILSADAGNGELEKIVINVPVLYETRTMRWTPEDIAKARNVMARLMVYERNLTNMRREGQAIMKDWNELLEGSVPAPALRADSPSLPYNHGQGSQSGGLPGSSSVIKVEQ